MWEGVWAGSGVGFLDTGCGVLRLFLFFGGEGLGGYAGNMAGLSFLSELFFRMYYFWV